MTKRTVIYKTWGIGLDTDLRVITMGKWDGDEAKRTIWEWSINDDGVIDDQKARRLFTYWDSPGDLKGNYKSPAGMIIDGRPVLVLEGIDAARRFNNAVIDVPEEMKERGRSMLDKLAEDAREEDKELLQSILSILLT